MSTFGTAWLVYGGLASLTTQREENKFGWDTFAIGATFISVGVLFRKLFYKRSLKMGNRYRLRMLDLRLPQF